MIYFRACPRCSGDVEYEYRDLRCIQCGWRYAREPEEAERVRRAPRPTLATREYGYGKKWKGQGFRSDLHTAV